MICGFEYWADCECGGKVYEGAGAEGEGVAGDVDTCIVEDDEDGRCENEAEDNEGVPGTFIDARG